MFIHDKAEPSPGTQPEDLAAGIRDRKRCRDCGHVAPATETNFTLISSQHGWRLSFDYDSDGRRSPVWRCPRCWKAHKATRAKQTAR